jgi:hypothetical protein
MPPLVNASLLGVFDCIQLKNFPERGSVTAFIVFLDVREPFICSVRISHPMENGIKTTILAEAQIVPNPPERSQETVQAAIYGTTDFAVEGRYEIQVYGNDTYLAHKPLLITKMAPAE